MAAEDYHAFALQHEEEVNLLQDMRAKEVERRKEAELEAEQLKEKLDRLEIERAEKMKTTGTCLRARLEVVIDDTPGPSFRGKKKATTTKNDNATKIDKLKNDKEVFVKSNHLDLRPLKKDAVQAICEKEGVQYTPLDKAKEDIVKARLARAFGTSIEEITRQNGVGIEEISDDNTAVSTDLGKTADGEDEVS
ncbi:hypothetical protein CBR_g39742 [Chara braunii]|uniref:Uncharacterized protein n=1 Tax=Chara braunii TaxID=69332 RepID=A0A388LS79_CHABU|nr:hypothetical protein CBR_g39742 [Chara braunii]|eukprot:GBG85177.1 hypothetical protein CBR_g39742 [Chara braunii]